MIDKKRAAALRKLPEYQQGREDRRNHNTGGYVTLAGDAHDAWLLGAEDEAATPSK